VTPRLAALLALAMLTCAPASAQPAGDEAAIRDVVRRYVEARERRDGEAIAALFTPDADQLVSSGEWRRGREALVKGTLASSARTGGTRAIDIESVRLLGADVAIADGRYEISGLEAGSSRRMWTSFALIRQRGGWIISGIRNMLPAAPADPPAPAAAHPEQGAILAIVDRFMHAVSTSDSAAFTEILLPEATSVVERPADGGGTRLARRPFETARPGRNQRERYWDPVVQVRGGIAVVWTPYEFWRDEQTSHCGVDVFDLAKEAGRWRIANMMWTVEPDACQALRPADASRIRPRP
jgi:uncharacterized protein (TIGR02246 family)